MRTALVFERILSVLGKTLLIAILLMSVIIDGNAQIDNLIVETWYIADANDATDTTEGKSLVAGMKTYRVFLDLAPGSRLKSIFGNSIHPLQISSTSDFYNNIDRPNAVFGYQINKAWFNGNPTLALDSWLTLGMTATAFMGVPKQDDTDGSFIGGVNNGGGTAGVPGGLLVNNDPLAGVPVTQADGYVPNTNVLGQWFDQGFKDVSGDDTTVFGALITGNEFYSTTAILQQNNGIMGADSLLNKVLVAQLTTLGELTLKLNIVLDIFDGNGYTTVTYVADGDSLLPGEQQSAFLSYPPACGCTDPEFLEYSSAYACSEPDSCQTPVVFGCMDTLACNYDPAANFNIPQICCYPGSCNDRNLMVVCPSLATARFGIHELFPNPARDVMTVYAGPSPLYDVNCTLIDSKGKNVMGITLKASPELVEIPFNIASLQQGIYRLVITNGMETDVAPVLILR